MLALSWLPLSDDHATAYTITYVACRAWLLDVVPVLLCGMACVPAWRLACDNSCMYALPFRLVFVLELPDWPVGFKHVGVLACASAVWRPRRYL